MKKKGLIIFDVIMSLIIMLSMCISIVAHNSEIGIRTQKLMAGNGNRSFSFVAAPEYQKVLAGATVTVDLKLEDIEMGEQGLNNVVGYLSYNEDVFEEVNISGKDDWIFENNQDSAHDMYGKFVAYTMGEGVSSNQDIATITLKLKENLEPQTTTLSFTNIKSSDGQVSVDAADKTAVIEIYRETPVNPDEPDGPVNPDQPDGPVTPDDNPKTPDSKGEESSKGGSSKGSKSIKTGDTIFIAALALLMATVAINAIVAVGNKDDKKSGVVSKVGFASAIAIIVLGLTMICTASFAHSDDITVLINNLTGTESWLDSDSYLVTDDNVSRIAPLTQIDSINSKFNKAFEIHKKDSSEIVTSGYLGTGMTIHADGEQQTISVLGDTDGDGDSNSVELTRIIRNVVAPATNPLSNTEKLSVDLNCDGNMDRADVNLSTNYILHGDLSIPAFDAVSVPSLTVVSGTYNEAIEAYEDTIQIKASKQDSAATTLKYKIEGSSTVAYTEIENNGIIELPNNGVYKVSVYNYGPLGNRSTIASQIYVKKSPNNNYTVKIRKENVDGTYEETTQTKSGRIGTTVTEEVTAPEGYELNVGASTLSGTVKENEDLELIITLDRKSYTLTINAGDYISEVKLGEEQNETTLSKSIKFGKTVSIDATVSELAGYSTNFDRWASSDTSVLANIGTKAAEFEMPMSNITLTASADRISDTDTRYKVEYYYQENGVYPAEATSSKNKNGETDTTVEVDETDKTPTRAGYVLDTARNENWSGTVAGDNSLVLKVYFIQKFTVAYKPGTHGTFETQTTSGIDFGATTPEFEGTLTHEEGYDFDGWEPTPTDKVRANAEYTAKWKEHTYDITYVLDGGTVEAGNPATYKISSETFTLNNPTKSGYTFKGWSGTGIDGQSTSVTIPQGSTGDKTYTANWEVINYAISYNLNGGSLGTDETTGAEITNPTSYNAETATFTLHNPRKTGYVFEGWTGTDLEEKTTTVTIEKGSIGDRSYEANWRASTTIPYHVKYYQEKLDGTGYDLKEDDPLSGTTGAEVSATIKSYTGFTYDENNENNVITANVAGDGSTVLKVYYSRNTYTLELTKDDNITAVTGADTYKYQAPVSIEATLKTETGYTITFIKWQSSDTELLEDKSTISAEFTMPAGNLMLAATSRKDADQVNYTVEKYFQVDGTYPAVADATETRQSATGSTVSVTNEDKETDEAGYTVDESRNDDWSNTVAGDGSTILKVYFKQQFTVTYKPGTHGTFTEQKTEHLDYGAATPTFVGNKTHGEGYEFTTWDKTVESTVTKSVEYVAEWSIINYTIEYELNGGTLGVDETTHQPITNPATYNVETVAFTLNNPTRAGYTFKGWTGTDLATATTTVTISQGSTGNRAYEATWEVIDYSITYNYDGGRLPTGVTNPATYNVETPTFRLNNPSKVGYTFLGWTGTDHETATDELDIAQGSTGNRSFTANWEANTDVAYHVKYFLESLESTDSDDEDNYIVQENVELSGTTGQSISAEIRSYTGFSHYVAHPNAKESGTIEGDGSAVLKVFYKRNSYDVTLTKDENIDTTTGANTYKYGEAVEIAATIKTEQGYTITFKEWETDCTSILTGDDDRKSTTATFTMPAENVELKATATKIANEVNYTVEYYYEGDGGYSSTPTDTDTRTAHVAETIEATNTDKTATEAGYEFDSEAANVLSATIPTSGSVTLKVYFKKGTYTLTVVAGDVITGIQLGEETAGEGETLTGRFKFGQSVTIDATYGTQTGYEISFGKWASNNQTLMPDNTTKNLTFTMPAGDVTLTATVNKVALETTYNVEYYYQSEGAYSNTPNDTIQRNGMTGEYAEITSADRLPILDGYAYDSSAPNKVENTGTDGLAADGSTTLKVYYKQQFTVTFKPGLHGNFEEATVSGLDYNTGIPSYSGNLDGKDGYIFSMWALTKIGDEVYQEGMPIPSSVKNNLEYTATWVPMALPTIEHEPTAWTRESVTVTITAPTDGYSIEYKIDDSEEWNLYTEPITIDQNCTIHARLAIGTNKGEEAEHEITNIDKIAPNIVSKTVGIVSSDEASITIQATDSLSGIVECGVQKTNYAGPTVVTCDMTAEKEFVFNEIYENGTYNIYVKDAAGNIAIDTVEVTTIEIYNVAKIVEAPEGYEALVGTQYTSLGGALTASDEAATQGNVKIEIIHNIPNEVNTIAAGRKYTINLNNFKVKEQEARTALTVNGEVTILDENEMGEGKIESTYGRAMYISLHGTASIGKDGDGRPSTYSPIIEGLTYGIVTEIDKTQPTYHDDVQDKDFYPEGTFNFYDGKIIGKTLALSIQKVADTPQMYDPTSIINPITGRNEVTLGIVDGFEAAIGKKRYTKIEDAIEDANDKIGDSETQVEVTVVKDIVKDAEHQIVVDDTKNIKLDLNGYKVTTTANDYVIKNYGKLEIVDSATEDVFYLEAEDIDSVFENAYNSSNRSYIYNNYNFSFDYNCKQLDNYTLDIDGYDLHRSVKIYVDGTLKCTTSSTDVSSGWKTYQLSLGELAVGNHTIRIVASSSYTYFDNFKIYKTDSDKTDIGRITSTTNSTILNSYSENITYENVDLTQAVPANTYYFESRAEGGLISNNAGKDNKTANSYICMDLSEKDGVYNVVIDYAISSENRYDFGYITVRDNNTTVPSYDDSDNRKLNISGTEDDTVSFNLFGGQKYYIYFGYRKDGSSAGGNDCFIIKNMKYGKNDKIGYLTISSGLVSVDKAGTSSEYTHAIRNDMGKVFINGGFVESYRDYSDGISSVNGAYIEVNGGVIDTKYNPVSSYAGTATNIKGGRILSFSNNAVLTNGTANINGTSVNIKSKGHGIQSYDEGYVVVEDATIRSNNSAIIGYNTNKDKIGVLVKNATIIASNKGIENSKDGIVKVENATIQKANTTISCSGSGMTIIDNITANAVNSSNTPQNNSGVVAEGNSKVIINNADLYTNVAAVEGISNANIEINGGLIQNTNSNNSTILYSGNQTLKITGGIIKGKANALYNSGMGTAIITGGELESQNSPAVATSNSGGTIIVGNNEDAISTEKPKIKSLTASAILNPMGTFKFYDGVLIGKKSRVIASTITDLPVDSELKTEIKADDLEYITLGIPTNAVAKINESYNPDVTGINANLYEKVEDEYFFKTLNAAIQACGNNATTIELIDDVIISRACTIGANQNITLKLNGKSISNMSDPLIENNGKLVVTNDQVPGEEAIYSSITANGKRLIKNNENAELTIEYVDIVYWSYQGGSSINLIDNYGKLDFKNSKYKPYTTSGTLSANALYNRATGIISVDNVIMTGNPEYSLRNVGVDIDDGEGNITYSVNIKNSNFSYTYVSGQYTYPYGVYNDSTGTIYVDNSTLTSYYGCKNSTTGKMIFKDSTVGGPSKNSGAGDMEFDNCIVNSEIENSNNGHMVIKNSTVKKEISNKKVGGTLDISDSTIDLTGYPGIDNYGTLNVTNVSIIERNQGDSGKTVFNRSGATAVISGSNTNMSGYCGIQNQGTMTILDGTYNATKYTGIINSGTLTLGKKDGNIIYKPVIKGYVQGISNTGTLKFYDGIIEGPTDKTITGTVPSELEDDVSYSTYKGENTFDDGTQSQYSIPSGREIAVLEVTSVVRVASSGEEYSSIADAYAHTQAEDTIELIHDVSITATTPSLEIQSGKNITIDLKNYNLAAGNNNTFINNGTFKIKDSLSHLDDDNNLVEGRVSTGASVLLENNGIATLDNGAYELSLGGTSSEKYCLIKNTNSLTINTSNTITAKNSYSEIVKNESGTTNINNCKLVGTSDKTTAVYVVDGTANIAPTSINASEYAVYVGGSGTANISVGTFAGKIYNDSDNGTIKITSGTVSESSNYVVNKKAGTIEIENATIRTRVENEGSGTINIKSGSFTTSTRFDYGIIYNSNSGTINITGGTFECGATCISNRGSGTITIDGSTLTAENPITITPTYDYRAYGVECVGSGDINIKGHVVINALGGSTDSYRGINFESTGTLTIGDEDNVNNNIKINAGKYGIHSYNSQQGTINYYGGTITAPVAVYGFIAEIPDGYAIVKTTDTDSNEVVNIGTNTEVVSVGGIKYDSLQDAIDNNLTGTIKVEKDFILNNNEGYTIAGDQNFTLDLNGHTITQYAYSNSITNNGILKIADLTAGKEGTIGGTIGRFVVNKNSLEIQSGNINVTLYKNMGFIYNDQNASIKISGGNITTHAKIEANYYYFIDNRSNNDVEMSGGNVVLDGKPSGHSWIDPTITVFIYNYVDADTKITGGTIDRSGSAYERAVYNNAGGHVYISGDTIIRASQGIRCGPHTCVTISENADLSGCSTSIKSEPGNAAGGADMVFDILGGKITSVAGSSSNYGETLNIRNSTLNGYIQNINNINLYEDATVSVNSSSDNSITYCGSVNIEGATVIGGIYLTNVRMNGGYIKGCSSGSVGISMTSGNTVTILSGKVEATSGAGIDMSGGTLTLGTNDPTFPNQTDPEIIGTTYGIKCSGTVNFYDGVLKGGTSAYSGSITNTPEMFKVVYDDETEKNARLGVDATYSQVAMVNGIYYADLETAVLAAINNNGQVDIAKNIVTAVPITIPADASIRINLNGCSITAYCQDVPFITNNGTLVIKDETDDGTSVSTIRNFVGNVLVNNGTFTLGINDATVYNNAPKLVGTTNSITNNTSGTFNFLDGRLGISETTGTILAGSGQNNKPTGYSVHTESNEMWLVAD